MGATPKQPSIAAKLLESLLTGTVESIARAGAKALESLTNDAAKAISNEAKKVAAVRNDVEQWRKEQLGEIVEIKVDAKVVEDPEKVEEKRKVRS